jgi:hypothetical protein
VKIYQDPYLLLRFLRIGLVRQSTPVFAAFFLDRKQRHAEQVLCARSDPLGDHQPTRTTSKMRGV